MSQPHVMLSILPSIAGKGLPGAARGVEDEERGARI